MVLFCKWPFPLKYGNTVRTQLKPLRHLLISLRSHVLAGVRADVHSGGALGRALSGNPTFKQRRGAAPPMAGVCPAGGRGRAVPARLRAADV